jgi:hypothetical protein
LLDGIFDTAALPMGGAVPVEGACDLLMPESKALARQGWNACALIGRVRAAKGKEALCADRPRPRSERQRGLVRQINRSTLMATVRRSPKDGQGRAVPACDRRA